MSQETSIQLFENAKIRVVWDDDAEKYFFSVVDVIAVLTESANPQTYWRVLKNVFQMRDLKPLQIVTL